MNPGNGLDLLISISLKHPELNAVRYDADHSIIGLEIALLGEITEENERLFIEHIYKCLELYHQGIKVNTSVLKVYFQRLKEITLLHLQRDMGTMSEGEMELALNVILDCFPGQIIYDRGDSITEEPFRNKVKQNLLRRISKDDSKNHFLAFRKQGRVLVFQK